MTGLTGLQVLMVLSLLIRFNFQGPQILLV